MRKPFIFILLVMTLLPLAGKDFRTYPGEYRLKSITGKWSDDAPATKYEYEYDESGKFVKSNTYYRPDASPQMFEYQYGDDGTLKDCVHYAEKNLKNGLTTYAFSKDKLLSRIEYNEKDLPLMLRFFTYDQAKRIGTETLIFNYAGNISQTLWLYEYGPKSAIASRTVYYGGLFDSKETYQYKTDNKGSTVTITANDGQKKPSSLITYLYDKKDRLMKKTVQYRDNDRCGGFTDTYTYGKEGNPETLTITDYEGKPVTTYTFEWESGKSLMPDDIFEEIIWNLSRVGC